MNDERRKILEMLAAGKITAAEAEELLDALKISSDKPSPIGAGDTGNSSKSHPKYFRIMVEPGNESGAGKQVNIRIPMAILRAGMRLGTMLPGEAQDKVNDALRAKGININLSDMKAEQFDELMAALRDMNIDVQDGDDKVRIFCE
jgi:hypothetical protein